MDSIELNRHLRALIDSGKSQDDVLLFLFSQKLSISAAIVAVRALYGIKLEEAKRIVSSNRYWATTHEANQGLHERLEVVARGKAQKRPSSN